MSKPKVGVFGITGCAGCQLSIIFNEDEILDMIKLIDLRAFPFIKEENDEEEFDLVLMEGLAASVEDVEKLKKIRSKTKFLVALGSCATSGCVPAYRNVTLKENYEHLLYKKNRNVQDVKPTPIDAHVKVDHYIPGCPPSKHDILTFVKGMVRGFVPKLTNSPVCVECRRNGNACLLDQGKPCLGPITQGGCNSVCINGGFECWGCRGVTQDMSLERMIQLLRDKGFDDKFIADRMQTFEALKIPGLTDALKPRKT